MNRSKVTIKDVALKAGVSVATVSRLVNGTGIVSEATAAIVQETIQELGYEPNLMARNLRKKETRVILIVCPNVTNPYYAHILAGITEASYQKGYSAVMYTTNSDPERELEGIQMLYKGRVDGAILMDGLRDYEVFYHAATRFPIVQCSEYVDTEIAPAVCIDNYQASRDMMDHLMGLGHTRIALISSDNDYISTKIRTQAYKDSLLQAGLSVNPGYIKLGSSDYSFQSGRACALELLQMDDPPSAIFCISDTFALGSTIAAKELDIPTPQELSISGFDDVEYTTMHHPYITTIAQPCYKLGEVSAQILFDRLEKGPARTGLVHLDHQLVVRESTAKKWIDPSGEES